jgi:hypothetical protein
VTTEPRTELRAEGGQVRFRVGRAPVYPAGQALEGAPSGRHGRAREQRSSYREVFTLAEFRALRTAQVLSFAGDQFAQVAIAILEYRQTHSAFLTALAYALTYLPPIAGGPLLPDVLPGDMFVLGSAVGNISFQASQIPGFVAGAAVVAVVDPNRTLGLDAVSFGISALIAAAGSRPRPLPRREAARPSLWAVSVDGIRIVFGNRGLLTLLLAGFYIVPEGLAAPYAHSLHGSTVTVGC